MVPNSELKRLTRPDGLTSYVVGKLQWANM
jgi:hypothetical protein